MLDNDTLATSQTTYRTELQQARREIAELTAERDRSIGGLLQLVRRYRRFAWAVTGTLQGKAAVGLALAVPGGGQWWLNAGSAVAGLGLAGYLVAPNARKLWAELRSMGSLTKQFRPQNAGCGRRRS